MTVNQVLEPSFIDILTLERPPRERSRLRPWGSSTGDEGRSIRSRARPPPSRVQHVRPPNHHPQHHSLRLLSPPPRQHHPPLVRQLLSTRVQQSLRQLNRRPPARRHVELARKCPHSTHQHRHRRQRRGQDARRNRLGVCTTDCEQPLDDRADELLAPTLGVHGRPELLDQLAHGVAEALRRRHTCPSNTTRSMTRNTSSTSPKRGREGGKVL